ncbi:hypothetical protein [Weissella viridescens]|uniref:hypothetical protein n=1 Tax=Weissella viridescens TaxID=1629 RepID=UPI003AF2ACA7
MMKTMTPKQVRKIVTNKYGTGFMAVLALSGSGMSLMQVAHAQDKDTNTTAAQSIDTKVANEAELDRSVADAKKAGVQVTEKPANVKTVPYNEVGKAKAEAEANYKQQIAELQKQAKAQAQATTNYNALNKKYEDAKNKYAGKTPVSDKTVDGTRVRAYGDYDESKKGGVGYYSKFEAIFDTQSGDKTRILSHSGWLEGAKMTRISGADKKAYTLKDVQKTYKNLKGADLQYYKNLRKGDVLKISEGKGAATDAITGQTYDLYLKVRDAPTSGTQYAGFKRSADNAVVVDFTGSTGVDFDLEFVPKGKPYTPANVIETVESSISYDIDANQAGQTNMMNAGVLNPKNSDVKVFGGDKYENISGGGFEDAKSIPGGSIGMFGKAKTFNFKFYANKNERAIKDRVGADQVAARFNLLGDGAKLNAVVKPPKTPALKAEVQKTEIKVQPGKTTPIEKAYVADISKWNLHKINVEEASSEKSGDNKSGDAKAAASKTQDAKSQTTDTKASSVSSAKGAAVGEKGASKTSENASTTDGKATSSTSAKTATTAKTAPVTADTKANATSQTEQAADKATQSTAAETSTSDKQTATSEKTSETQNAGTASDKTEDSKATNTNKVKKDQKYGYTLNTTIDTIDEDGKLINSFGFNDPLEKALAVDGAQIVDHTDKDKDITSDFKFSGKVKATLNSDKLAGLRGHKVEMRVGVHVDENQDLSAYKQADGTYLIKNAAEKEQNGKTTPSNRVDVTLDKDPEKPAEPKKEVPKQPEKPSKPQEVAANTGEDTVLNRIVDWVKNLF